MGITQALDQKQVSETKAVISDVLSRLEKIKQENEYANKIGVQLSKTLMIDFGKVALKTYPKNRFKRFETTDEHR